MYFFFLEEESTDCIVAILKLVLLINVKLFLLLLSANLPEIKQIYRRWQKQHTKFGWCAWHLLKHLVEQMRV